MFDLLKANRINKISADHSERISDYLILMNIVSSTDAKKNLPAEEYASFDRVFKDIAKRKDERPANSLQYQHRAFAIAYEFELRTNIAYSKICGDATDILFMYRNTKPKFDEDVNGICEEFLWVIGQIDASDTIKLYLSSIAYFTCLTRELIQATKSLLENEIARYRFEIASKKLLAYVLDSTKARDGNQLFSQYFRDAKEMSQQAYDNCDTLDKYIETFTDTFLSMQGVPSDQSAKQRLVFLAKEWRQG